MPNLLWHWTPSLMVTTRASPKNPVRVVASA